MAGKNGKNNKESAAEDTVEPLTDIVEQNVEQTIKAAETTKKATVEATKAFVEQTAEVLEEAAGVKPKNGRRTKAESNQAEETEGEVGFSPKTFLIPYMLLMLRDSLMHGYAIWERLMLMGIPGLDESDRATIYRTLRQLEREGKVKSEWNTAADGPAKRVYSLTDAGENFLQIWAVGLNQYRQSLDFFFKMYTGGTLPSPFDFFPKSKFGNNSKGEK